MNNTIYKYRLADHITESQIKVPIGAEFLSLAVQFNEPVAYFKVNDKQTEMDMVQIFAAATGGFLPSKKFVFMGAAILNGGNYVLHYFYFK